MIPSFPECNHSLVKSLAHYSDQELLTLFQRHTDAGQYFTAIFCRYSAMVYTLIRHSARSPVQADYLFATTWRHIFYELSELDLRHLGEESGFTLQSWLLNITAICMNQTELPPVEAIHYNLQAAPPPLWCYMERALEYMPPILRLMVLMAQTFGWSETRIAAYLQAEGDAMSPTEVRVRLQEGYRLLEESLPEDVRAIYLAGNTWTQDNQLATK
ncbi:RNA polymerase sigma factor [Leptodesmis sp.]|uniref:RNA polymerase sigma factor n=1 Tax=Leptodesmis sp. TaxID=3100501 RepID=UPI0040534C2B